MATAQGSTFTAVVTSAVERGGASSVREIPMKLRSAAFESPEDGIWIRHITQ
jgi:hypothetical protein